MDEELHIDHLELTDDFERTQHLIISILNSKYLKEVPWYAKTARVL